MHDINLNHPEFLLSFYHLISHCTFYLAKCLVVVISMAGKLTNFFEMFPCLFFLSKMDESFCSRNKCIS